MSGPLPALLRRLGALFGREARESDLDRELRFHLEMQIEELVRRGMPRARARTEALRLFGGVEKYKEDIRDRWGARLLNDLARDTRIAWRGLLRAPIFSLGLILTLALAIGANSAIFSAVYGVLLRPLPYADAGQLVTLRQFTRYEGTASIEFSPTEMREYVARAKTIQDAAEYHSMWFNLLGGREPERLQVGVVSPHFFDLLGVTPALGRGFAPTDNEHGAEAVILLTHEFWTRAFDGDPDVAGRVVRMNDRPHRIVGVLPPLPGYPAREDVYVPVAACPFRMSPRTDQQRGARMIEVIARLRPGFTAEDASDEMRAISAELAAAHPQAYPAHAEFTAGAISLHTAITRGARRTLLLLLGVVLLVLLIGCTNVANLTLARLSKRERELSIRAALGASRARLARQLLTETMLIAIIGGVAGLGVGVAGLSMLVTFAERFTPRASEIAMHPPVLLFTLAAALLSGLVAGVLPAISARAGTRPPPRRRIPLTFRQSLVVVQVAVSLALLTGAGLTLRSLARLSGVDSGFDGSRVLSLQASLDWARYVTAADGAAIQARFLERIRREPGVQHAAIAGTVPFTDRRPFRGGVLVEGQTRRSNDAFPTAAIRVVSDGYFETMRVPILKGRGFSVDDRDAGKRVAVISQAMARRFWPAADPVGRRFSLYGDVWHEVIGVAADVRQELDLDVAEELYLPTFEQTVLEPMFIVRSDQDLDALGQRLKAAIHEVDPEQPISELQSLESARAASLAPPRLTAALLVVFAGVALAITFSGISGMLAFNVSHRARELGIRMALGASRRSVVGLVMRQGLKLVAIGLAAGLVLSAAGARAMSGLLYGVSPGDGVTFSAVLIAIVSLSALACFVPARRAVSIDPLDTIREA